MKKLFAILLAVTMLITVSAAASAATIETGDGNDSVEVNATYVQGVGRTSVYKVDITWGSMAFTYSEASDGTWDPETHTYNGKTEGGWSWEDNANKITVVNHSNEAIHATLTANMEETVAGKFVDEQGQPITVLDLATAEGTLVDNAPNADAWFEISGTISASGKVGTITVTLGAAE